MSTGRKVDWSLFFFIALAVGICCESYRLGIGRPNAPLSGFFPFLTGLFLGGISGSKLIFSPGSAGGKDRRGAQLGWRKVLPLAGLFLGYILALEVIGFFAATFMFVFLVITRIEAKPLWVAAVSGAAISSTLYFIFRSLLHVQLPRSFIGV